MFLYLLPEVAIGGVVLELTSGLLRKKYEGKSHSNFPCTSMSSGCSSRETSGLLELTVHLRLTDFSMTEGV